MDSQTTVTTFAEPALENGEEVKQSVPKSLAEIIAHEGNLCELIDDSELNTHIDRLMAGIELDRNSMSHYIKSYDKAIKRAKLMPENETKSFPIDHASNVVMPYVLDAALDFNARSAPPLLERQDICSVKINGKDEYVIPPDVMQALQQLAQTQGEEVAQQAYQQVMAQIEKQPKPKQARADRVSEMINYDLTCGIPMWREQQDKALFLLAIVGMYFKKTWQCPRTNKRKSELVYPDKLIFDHNANSFEDAPRKSFEFTQSRNDVVSAIRTGQYIGMDDVLTDTETTNYEMIESHCNLDLDDDGYAEPYIAVIDRRTGKCVSLARRYHDDDIQTNKRNEVVDIKGEDFFTQTIFIPDPTGTCTGLGYGILMSGMFDVIDTNTNQMIDAGTLNNTAANTGLIRIGGRVGGRAGGRQKKGDYKLVLGQLTAVEGSGNAPLQQDIAQLPFAGPSESLRMLLEQLKVEAREMTAVSQLVESNPGQPMGLYLAKLHQSLVKPNSIMIRVFNGLTKEFKRIYDIQKRYLGQEQYQEVLDDPNADWEADYNEDSYDIKTTADPSQGSEIERATRAETMLDRALQLPQVFDLRYAAEQWVESIGADAEKYLPPPQPGEPDPIQLMIAQAQQTMSEAEKMQGQASMISAQAKLIDANISLAKMDIEIEKLESEVLKNLSEVDKNQEQAGVNAQKLVLDNLKSQRDDLRELINVAQIGSQRMAQTPSNQGFSGSTQIGMPSPEDGLS